jgi:hypothetical protein
MAMVGENKMKGGKGTKRKAVWGLSRTRYSRSRLNSAFSSTFVLLASTPVLPLQLRIIINKPQYVCTTMRLCAYTHTRLLQLILIITSTFALLCGYAAMRIQAWPWLQLILILN